MRLAAVLIAALGVGGVASAAPPPPRIFPEDLPKTLDGYDLQPLLGAYDLWVQTSQGRILRTSFGDGMEWQGKSWRGQVASSEIVQSDYGALRVDRLTRYCEGEVAASTFGACTYRYQYVFMPDRGNDAARRAFADFRPKQLTAFLAKEGWKADYSWKGVEKLQQLFARHTNLKAIYEPSLERHDVSSAQCPALEKAIASLKAITISLDQSNFGDGLGEYPAPHGALTQIEITGLGANGQPLTVKGSTALYPVMQPIWDAVESCSPPSYRKGKVAS